MDKQKDGAENVIYPKTKFDERLMVERECDVPDTKLFMELGFNKTKEDNLKHYRRYYNDELENCKEVMPDPVFLH